MKKILMIFFSILLVITTSSCSKEEVAEVTSDFGVTLLTYSTEAEETGTTEIETSTTVVDETEAEVSETETMEVTEQETEQITETTTTTIIPEVSTEYKVKYGDTLSEIAILYGITVDDIIACNGLDGSGTIYAGQTLILPGVDSLISDEISGENSDDSNDTAIVNTVENSSVTLWTTGADSNSWYNIELAASYLNGMTLGPGESFSWASYMGPNDTSQGYKEAGVYSGGQTSTAPGGGVCFVSTTLMQAARDAGCIITEKHDHSLPVSYASPGNEASVSWGTWDLRFYNPSNTLSITFYVSTDAASRSCTISCNIS